MDDERWELYLRNLAEQEDKWRQFRDDVTMEVREHKSTINRAVGLLADEALRFQKLITDRLDRDDEKRTKRQQDVDAREQRKDRIILGTAGCLILTNGIGLVVLVGVVLWLITR